MTLLADFEQFASDHRVHGPLTANATEPAWNGYLLTMACSCGVLFGRWITRPKRPSWTYSARRR